MSGSCAPNLNKELYGKNMIVRNTDSCFCSFQTGLDQTYFLQLHLFCRPHRNFLPLLLVSSNSIFLPRSLAKPVNCCRNNSETS